MKNNEVVIEQVLLKKQYMVSFEAVYSQSDFIDPLILLKDIPLAALEEVAYLLVRITNIQKEERRFHSSYLLGWMMRMTGIDQRKVLQFVQTNPIFNLVDFLITSQKSCLRLIQIILEVGCPIERELSKNDWGMLFKSLLICNTIEIKKQEEVFNWNNNEGTENFMSKILPIRMRNLEIERRKDYKVQLLKASYFFEFCKLDNEYKSYLESFLSFYSFKSYEEYIWNILHPFLLMMTNDEITCKIHIDQKDISTINFFKHFLINDKKVTLDEDYLLLRQFPILYRATNTYIFLNINFFIDKLYHGFLFDFVDVLKKSGLETFDYGQLKRDMGNRFSETHLFYMIMEKCFTSFGNFRNSGTDLKKKLDEREPDYILRNENEIFLFEFKDSTINSNIKYSEDASIIKDELLEKFESTKKNVDKPKNKAVNQLKNSIVDILNSKFQQKEIDNFEPNNVIIYPIFVFTDVVMEASGVNYFLKERLNALIENENLPKNRIRDMVLINLDTLILYQDLFKESLIDFGECVKSYLGFVSQGSPETKLSAFDEYFKYYIVRKGFKVVTKPKDFDEIIKSFISKDT
ncbi:hypothetical protein GVN16_07190 [Emticicia sp. CRIBPO]|uniref:hypothetical protein n=1 Tax=Emticicia sp. CRIBPO TaxID=2683258 RepID=UPI0014127023|nr:hypothetical protein [Emticicia sp. CRIBPO]NBA85538.1 hypothetical protein [Emticicia sp. CRIBPO]